MDILQFIAKLRAGYEAVYAKAGRDPKAELATQQQFYALSKEDDDGGYMLRVSGPMDPFNSKGSTPELIAELDAAKPTALRVLFDSPGGLVSYGFALYSDLIARKREGMALTCEARGIVASAATLPFLAADADSRIMGDGSMLMIHNVWGFLMFMGDAAELEKEAARQVKAMRAMTDNYAAIVAKSTGMKAADVTAAMSAETWYSAEESVENGFAAKVAGDADDPKETARLRQHARVALAQFRLGYAGA